VRHRAGQRAQGRIVERMGALPQVAHRQQLAPHRHERRRQPDHRPRQVDTAQRAAGLGLERPLEVVARQRVAGEVEQMVAVQLRAPCRRPHEGLRLAAEERPMSTPATVSPDALALQRLRFASMGAHLPAGLGEGGRQDLADAAGGAEDRNGGRHRGLL
jgi:hypothetical protein